MVELPSFPSFEWDFLVIDTPKGEDLILGFDFLNHFNPYIDWRQGLITFNSDHKDYYDPSKSFSNDFSSAKSCAALVGDSRTPSFPSSVHIPSLNSHQSLLSSRDEVFKEIQDEIPPSSYHDSLEDLWDEEEKPEEIETMMKVVPSVYHQYSDVFSKVKAEKHPPHHACDHHIKLEGSLPLVGVIYSLSNQESDTLTAYISENVEKGFIQPSSSSTGAAVLFVKKKDGALHLCVDYRKLNARSSTMRLISGISSAGELSSFEVLTKNSSLQYFMSSDILTHCQARWTGFLPEFHFSITYCPGCLATLPNALSRWCGMK
ncbi:hypothetical protein O181_028676 [Austropuccinia psidii MF-1]|uniref:Reverse transcriptase/retrotransposon-derived protein RNase H-like domain-containing protein n=1 Tax=Austropuccinia psidii MF-1 TaxID=1389203 RepID=A0A9Q3CV08_9BASI|nr:hypothetical protein [Austropuccinia psidii MF-1]